MWRALLRFGLLGAAFFAADRLWNREPRAPILISAAQVEALRDEFSLGQGRAPSAGELEQALAPLIEEELLYREALRRGYERGDPVIFRRLVQNLRFAGADPDRTDASLYREALALGLHETDVVVRRRLVQQMRFELESGAASEAPDEATLRAHHAARAERYTSPARVAFTQLYFRPEREAELAGALPRLRDAELAGALPRLRDAELAGALPRLRDAGLSPAGLGLEPDAFLHPAEQPSQTRQELADRFGAGFADAVFAAQPGGWQGPLASAFGIHLVFVREREPERALAFEEVAERVRLEWLAEQRQRALRRALAALRARAELRIEEGPEGSG